jgi:hypothetical protein
MIKARMLDYIKRRSIELSFRSFFYFSLRFVGIREGILQCFREKAYREVRQTLSLAVC